MTWRLIRMSPLTFQLIPKTILRFCLWCDASMLIRLEPRGDKYPHEAKFRSSETNQLITQTRFGYGWINIHHVFVSEKIIRHSRVFVLSVWFLTHFYYKLNKSKINNMLTLCVLSLVASGARVHVDELTVPCNRPKLSKNFTVFGDASGILFCNKTINTRLLFDLDYITTLSKMVVWRCEKLPGLSAWKHYPFSDIPWWPFVQLNKWGL